MIPRNLHEKNHEEPATAVAMGRSASSVAMPVPTCQGGGLRVAGVEPLLASVSLTTSPSFPAVHPRCGCMRWKGKESVPREKETHRHRMEEEVSEVQSGKSAEREGHRVREAQSERGTE